MSLDDLIFWPIEQLAPLLAKRKVSPVELVETLLGHIERVDRRAGGPQLGAYLTVTAEQALAQARRAEKELGGSRGRGRCRGPLHGVPISVKDNIWTRGVRTTAGSKILSDFIPNQDAAVVRRLRRAGAIVLGKTNLHEFAYGVTTNNPHFGPTRNPWDTARIPGGSSGGSAAAIAAGLCFASLGSDTGGSIRIPAALCGIVGLKPTFGRVSCQGLVPLAPSLDHTGPLTRTVADAAILLGVIAGAPARAKRWPHEPMSASRALEDYARGLRTPLARLRLGWPREYFWEKLDNEVRLAVETAAHSFEREGARVEEVSLPHIYESVEAAKHIALAEARHVHESAGWFPARARDYGEDVRRWLELGADVRATDYLHAFEVRKVVQADFDLALAHVDAILAPSVPIPAPLIGDRRVTIGSEEETVRSALLRLNRPANFIGLPAISVPCGFTRGGLPVGLQFIGRAFDEAKLLRIAHTYEQAQDWHRRHPPRL